MPPTSLFIGLTRSARNASLRSSRVRADDAAKPATFGNSRLADMLAAGISCNAVGHRARRRQPAAMCCLVRRRRSRGWSVDANGKLTAIGINAAAEEAVHGHQLRPLTTLY